MEKIMKTLRRGAGRLLRRNNLEENYDSSFGRDNNFDDLSSINMLVNKRKNDGITKGGGDNGLFGFVESIREFHGKFMDFRIETNRRFEWLLNEIKNLRKQIETEQEFDRVGFRAVLKDLKDISKSMRTLSPEEFNEFMLVRYEELAMNDREKRESDSRQKAILKKIAEIEGDDGQENTVKHDFKLRTNFNPSEQRMKNTIECYWALFTEFKEYSLPAYENRLTSLARIIQFLEPHTRKRVRFQTNESEKRLTQKFEKFFGKQRKETAEETGENEGDEDNE